MKELMMLPPPRQGKETVSQGHCLVCMCALYLSFMDTGSEENSKVPTPRQGLRGMNLNFCVRMSVYLIFVCTDSEKNSKVPPPRQRLTRKKTVSQGCCLVCMCVSVFHLNFVYADLDKSSKVPPVPPP